MKPAGSSNVRILLVILVVTLIASLSPVIQAQKSASSGAIFANGPADGGRLYIKRSPVLPFDVTMTLTIDGKIAGTLVWAREFDRYITPGRHVVVASPNQLRDEWVGIIDVRAGQTYTYFASYNVNRIVLERVKSYR